MVNEKYQRQHYIDWLRGIAVMLLVPFHTGMIFVTWGFHIKNDTTSVGITMINWFINMWHMPLFFFISGASTWYALGFRNSSVYIKERFLRLFVPLVFGMLVVVPPQVYIERIKYSQFKGSFIEFYPHIFNGVYPHGNLSWHHLWFLVYLLLHSLLTLPLFLFLRSKKGEKALTNLTAFFSNRTFIYLLAMPFMFVQATVMRSWPNGDQNLLGDLDNFFLHMLMFVYGYLFCSSTSFLKTIEINRKISLTVGILLVIFGFLFYFRMDSGYFKKHHVIAAILLLLNGLNTWCWLLAFLGYAKLFLNYSNRFLKYAKEAALPFYVLHQTVILIIAFYVLQLFVGIVTKYLLIIILSFAATVVIYDISVKRVGVFRFLFGMRPKSAYHQTE